MINITKPTVTQNDEDDGNDNDGNEDDKDKKYCLNTSSKALWDVYLGLIGLAMLWTIILIGALLYCKLKKKSKKDMTMVTQVEVVNQSYVIILENIQNPQAEQNQESLSASPYICIENTDTH